MDRSWLWSLLRNPGSVSLMWLVSCLEYDSDSQVIVRGYVLIWV